MGGNQQEDPSLSDTLLTCQRLVLGAGHGAPFLETRVGACCVRAWPGRQEAWFLALFCRIPFTLWASVSSAEELWSWDYPLLKVLAAPALSDILS